jgi:hypothetical protein
VENATWTEGGVLLAKKISMNIIDCTLLLVNGMILFLTSQPLQFNSHEYFIQFLPITKKHMEWDFYKFNKWLISLLECYF